MVEQGNKRKRIKDLRRRRRIEQGFEKEKNSIEQGL